MEASFTPKWPFSIKKCHRDLIFEAWERTNANVALTPVSERLQIRLYLRAGPVLRSHKLPPDDSLAVNDVGFRPHVCLEECGCGLFGIADSDEVYMTADKEILVFIRILVDAYADNRQVGQIVVQLDERGQLDQAGRAPCGPEIEQDDVAAIAGKVHGGGAVGDGKVRRQPAGLRGERTPVAAGREGQGQENEKKQKTGEQHILIIRSERAA